MDLKSDQLIHGLEMSIESPCRVIKGRWRRFEMLRDERWKDQPELTSSFLNEKGFRKTLNAFTRSACVSCKACKPSRIVVDEFRPNRTQRRALDKNRDLTVNIPDRYDIKEHFSLRHSFNRARQFGDIPFDDLRQAMASDKAPVKVMEARLADGRLLAGAVFEDVADGTSGDSFYYDPQFMERSLGTFMVLQILAYTRQKNLPYCYPGAWTNEKSAFSYKSNFQPFEIRDPQSGWRRWTPADVKPA